MAEMVFVSGYVRCQAGLYLQVEQEIRLMARVGGTGLFAVDAYSYKGILADRGTIFRYDSPHADHNTEHHVHEFATVGDPDTATVRFLYGEDEVPTLADALRRLYHWHLDNTPIVLL
ncbi:MAG TPA: hypothetical protein VFQ45_03135 [Longimicrobium sp.]|nr:hypothetical protein [Longimicrobium sp.]